MTARMAHSLSWVSVAFAIQQVIRLGTNVVLASIISPAVFGVMLILNTLRTGVEQLSDVGIGQNIVFDPAGDNPRFYNTAWTIQIIRGFILFAVFLAITPLLAQAFEKADVGNVLPLLAPIFLITGCATPAYFLLQKSRRIAKRVSLEVVIAVLGSLITIGMALISPTAQSLVYALLMSTMVGTTVAATSMNWRSLRLQLDLKIVRKIISFGKWVFVATLLYFAATSFDRLYLGATIPVALLGVYGIARTFSDAAFQLAHKISILIIFPTVAHAHHAGGEMARLVRPRQLGLVIAGSLVGAGMAVADLTITLLYDDRYLAATFILPVLLFGTWFSILSVVNESVAYGSGKPAINAGANAAKFIWLVALLPYVLKDFGFLGALLVIGLSDVPRYVFLACVNQTHRLQFFAQDVAATVTMLCTAALVRSVMTGIGIVAKFWPAVPAALWTA